MLVPEDLGGGSVSGDGAARPRARGRGDGAAGLAGSAPPGERRRRHDRPVRHVRSSRTRELGALVERASASRPGRSPSRQDAWDAAGVTLAATERTSGWVLAGTKSYVQDAAVADAWLVTARTGDGLTQFLVPATRAGVTVRAAAVARHDPPLRRRSSSSTRSVAGVDGRRPGRRRRRRRRTSAPGRVGAAERRDRRRDRTGSTTSPSSTPRTAWRSDVRSVRTRR